MRKSTRFNIYIEIILSQLLKNSTSEILIYISALYRLYRFRKKTIMQEESQTMKEYNDDLKVIESVKCFNQIQTCKMRMVGENSKGFDVNVRVLQGCILSPLRPSLL